MYSPDLPALKVPRIIIEILSIQLEREQQLHDSLVLLERQLGDKPNENTYDKIEKEKEEFKQIDKVKNDRIIFRSRARWYEYGEKSSKYFLSLEKRNYVNKTVSKLYDEETEQYITNTKLILEKEKKFYQSLYTENVQCSPDNILDFIENNNIPKLNERSKNICDELITELECKQAVKELKNAKCPGCDGLPAEFYKLLWNDIKHLVIDSLYNALDSRQMSVDQKRRVITLIPKKERDRTKLSNWRPITLLNTDYKIIAKVLFCIIFNKPKDVIN